MLFWAKRVEPQGVQRELLEATKETTKSKKNFAVEKAVKQILWHPM